ncbi:MAG: potassium-transporting ATPase subunit KdpC [Acidobacteriota bacterium]
MKLALQSTLYVLVLTLLLGVAYPAAVTLVSQLAWPDQANGSLVTRGGGTVGSRLIGQRFAAPSYLHPRPSAAGRDGYDPRASGGRNKGPTDRGLAEAIAAAVKAAREDRPGDTRPVPADLVTASASGLDPHISPDAAFWQAARVAGARGISEAQVEEVIRRHVEPRTFGILGEPRVNVLLTNLDLDTTFPRP